MRGAIFPLTLERLFTLIAPLLAFAGCSASQPPTRPAPPTPPLFMPPPELANVPKQAKRPTVLLGIDVLEASGFAAVKGKRIGLLTHPAGVNRNGVSTIEVLRRAPGVTLAALYGPEHGIYGDTPAEIYVASTIDRRTGLPVHSLYGKTRKPTPGMLKGIDALVVDLQDIGTRSYTFVSAMKLAMEACFENGKEVIVLDRPNPLGGLKADGPLLDTKWKSYVGAFGVPYVHGLTIGELAKMAKDVRPPSVSALAISEEARVRGKLTVIPMFGWTRAMRWPETGLKWVPTSQYIQDFAAVLGYPMVGLGTYLDPRSKFDIGFRHGVGTTYAFRGLAYPRIKSEVLEKELRALRIPGLQFRRVSAPDRSGRAGTGVYVEIIDFDAWRPTELNFHLMVLACKLDTRNPFAPVPGRDFGGFLRHMGSEEFLTILQRQGAQVNLDAWLHRWREQASVYQQMSRKYWLYK